MKENTKNGIKYIVYSILGIILALYLVISGIAIELSSILFFASGFYFHESILNFDKQ